MDGDSGDELLAGRFHRRPLDAAALSAIRHRLIAPGRFVTRVDAIAQSASTNADLLRAAAAGAPEGTVLVAHHQSAGRGRLDRAWVAPPGAGLTFSFVVRPGLPRGTWSWLPLLAGLAVRAAVAVDGADPSTVLKWPNDVLAGRPPGKLAGVLVQTNGPAAVVGIGVNVDQDRGELPGPEATSLRLLEPAGRTPAALLVGILEEWEVRYREFIAAQGDADRSGAREEYRATCATLGQAVDVQRAGSVLRGTAVDVAADGALVVRPAGHDGADVATPGTADVTVSAGDVVHLRATAG